MDEDKFSRYEVALKSIVQLADWYAAIDKDQWMFDAIYDVAAKALNPDHVTDDEHLQAALKLIMEFEGKEDDKLFDSVFSKPTGDWAALITQIFGEDELE